MGWTLYVHWASIFSFISVFILWSLNNIAVEIEMPFGTDDNDLDTSEMQESINERLMQLTHPAVFRTPTLSRQAVTRDLAVGGRRSFRPMGVVLATYNEAAAEQLAVEALGSICVAND